MDFAVSFACLSAFMSLSCVSISFPPAPSVVLLQTRSKYCCKLIVLILLPTRRVTDGRCDWDMACTSRATAPQRSRPRQRSILIPGTVNCPIDGAMPADLKAGLWAPKPVAGAGLCWLAMMAAKIRSTNRALRIGATILQENRAGE